MEGRFEGYYLEADDLAAARAALAAEGLAGWAEHTDAAPGGRVGVRVSPPPGTVLAPAAAWEQARALSARLGGAEVEPLLETRLPEPPDSESASWSVEATSAPGTPPDGEPDARWHWVEVGVQEAWDLETRPRGQGVRIGHPDTGYTRHPALWPADAASKVLPAQGLDLVDGGDPADELEAGPGLFPGHGTRTSSVIGARWTAEEYDGVAPEAEIIPIRASRSVVVFSPTRLAQAIDHAVAKGCHIVSISMGGPAFLLLRRACERAEAAGTLIVAAAGNYTGIVVWPAAYEQVVACAASGRDKAPWKRSARGPDVDVTAPGADVWVATWDDEGNAILHPGSGTSFATAITAGAAALWMSHHGVARLRERYPGPALPRAFRWVLANAPKGALSTDEPWRYGGGILRVPALLAHRLPEPEDLEDAALPEAMEAPASWALASARLAGADVAEAAATLGTLLGAPPAELGPVEVELRFLLTSRPEARAALARGDVEALRGALWRGASPRLRDRIGAPAPRGDSGVVETAVAAAHVSVPSPLVGPTTVKVTIPVEITLSIGGPEVGPAPEVVFDLARCLARCEAPNPLDLANHCGAPGSAGYEDRVEAYKARCRQRCYERARGQL